MSTNPKPLTIKAGELRDLCADRVELANSLQRIQTLENEIAELNTRRDAILKSADEVNVGFARTIRELQTAISTARDLLRNVRTDINEIEGYLFAAKGDISRHKRRLLRNLAVTIGKLDQAGITLFDADLPF